VHTRAHQRAPMCTNVHNVYQRAQRVSTCINVHNVCQRVPTCTTCTNVYQRAPQRAEVTPQDLDPRYLQLEDLFGQRSLL